MKLPDRYYYPAVFGYEEGEEISVFFPDLDVATSGVNEMDALVSARELLGLSLYGMEEDYMLIPSPSSLKDVIIKSNERVILVDVYMPSVRNAQVNRSVNRTVTLPAWLNSLALEHNVNFSQVLQDALKKQLLGQPESAEPITVEDISIELYKGTASAKKNKVYSVDELNKMFEDK